MNCFVKKNVWTCFILSQLVELEKIQEQGKIPRLEEWPNEVALDDLMTQSALQSFTKDQSSLDDRIRSFL